MHPLRQAGMRRLPGAGQHRVPLPRLRQGGSPRCSHPRQAGLVAGAHAGDVHAHRAQRGRVRVDGPRRFTHTGGQHHSGARRPRAQQGHSAGPRRRPRWHAHSCAPVVPPRHLGLHPLRPLPHRDEHAAAVPAGSAARAGAGRRQVDGDVLRQPARRVARRAVGRWRRAHRWRVGRRVRVDGRRRGRVAPPRCQRVQHRHRHHVAPQPGAHLLHQRHLDRGARRRRHRRRHLRLRHARARLEADAQVGRLRSSGSRRARRARGLRHRRRRSRAAPTTAPTAAPTTALTTGPCQCRRLGRRNTFGKVVSTCTRSLLHLPGGAITRPHSWISTES